MTVTPSSACGRFELFSGPRMVPLHPLWCEGLTRALPNALGWLLAKADRDAHPLRNCCPYNLCVHEKRVRLTGLDLSRDHHRQVQAAFAPQRQRGVNQATLTSAFRSGRVGVSNVVSTGYMGRLECFALRPGVSPPSWPDWSFSSRLQASAPWGRRHRCLPLRSHRRRNNNAILRRAE